MIECRAAISRIVPGISSIFPLREVRTFARVQAKQIVVAFTNHEDVAPLRKLATHEFPDLLNELLILQVLSAAGGLIGWCNWLSCRLWRSAARLARLWHG